MSLVQPSVGFILCVIHACRKFRTHRAMLIYVYVRRLGMEMHASFGSYLVSMLAEAGWMQSAAQVFGELNYHDKYAWSSLVTAYIKCGELQYAFSLFRTSKLDISLDSHKYVIVTFLKACSYFNDLEMGSSLHSLLMTRTDFEKDAFIGSALVSMYVKFGSLAKAEEVFCKVLDRDAVLWTSLIRGYMEYGYNEEALEYVGKMPEDGISPDAFTIVCSLKACASLCATEKGQGMHAEAVKKGFETDLVVGNSLIDMYAQCGLLATAQDLFDNRPVRDIVSWNGLMSGSIEHGDEGNALKCFDQMLRENIIWNSVTFVCSLKACGMMRDTVKAQEIHMWIGKIGLEKDIITGNSLIHVYARCRLLEEASNILRKLPVRDVISWTSLLTAYVDHGFYEEALHCFQTMQSDGVGMSIVTYVCCVRACGTISNRIMGYEIHATILEKGWETELLVGNALIDMYAKWGALDAAWYVFKMHTVEDVVSWNVMISGYVENVKGDEALCCLERMEKKGIILNSLTVVYSLQACTLTGNISKAHELHSHVIKRGYEGEVFLRNAMVAAYAKCGICLEAEAVFQKHGDFDMVSYCALMTGYSDNGFDDRAIHCLRHMDHNTSSMNIAMYCCCLKVCGNTGSVIDAQDLHMQLVRKGFEMDGIVGSSLIDMYAKCGLLEESQQVFEKLPVNDVVSRTALIAGHISSGCFEEALRCFQRIQDDMLYSNAVTYVCILKICGSIGSREKSLKIHCEILKIGFEKDSSVGTTLIYTYARCGLLEEAESTFNKLSRRDDTSARTLLSGYVEYGLVMEALMFFKEMLQNGTALNSTAYIYILRACRGGITIITAGMEIHSEIMKIGVDNDVIVGNALIDFYARNSCFAAARNVFEKLPAQDVVSWNSIIAGYAESGYGEEALLCIGQMHDEGLLLRDNTLISTIKVCENMGAIVKGCEIHSEMLKRGLGRDNLFGNILISMYSKCGLLTEAHMLFDRLTVLDSVSWNSLMTGYTLLGKTGDVFNILNKMLGINIRPNLLTFINVLNVCNHDGLVNKAEICFEILINRYCCTPLPEHYTCMLDLFGRAGQIEKVIKHIGRIPLHPDVVMWHAVLAACRKWGHVEFANVGFAHAVELNEKVVATYVSMANILNKCYIT